VNGALSGRGGFWAIEEDSGNQRALRA